MLSNVFVDRFVAVVLQNEEQVETGHNGRRDVDIQPQRLAVVVASTSGICRCENRSARVQRRLDARLGDTYCLLFHRFVDSNLVFDVHFVELVYAAHAVVRKHESTSFDAEFASFAVFNDAGSKTCSRGSLATRVNSPRAEI